MRTMNRGDPSRRAGARRRCQGEPLRLWAAVIWVGACLIVDRSINAPWRLIVTGAHAEITAKLPDQSEFAVGPNSRIRVNDEKHVAHVDRGQVTIHVPPGLIQPFVVETFLARATVSAEAKFRVTADSSVQFDIYEGIVRVYKRGAKAEAPGILLRKGDTYRVPVDAMASVVGGNRGGVSVMLGG